MGVVFLVALVAAFAALLVAVVVLLFPAGQAVTGVSKTALYLHAETGEQPEAFADVDLAAALS